VCGQLRSIGCKPKVCGGSAAPSLDKALARPAPPAQPPLATSQPSVTFKGCVDSA
jgi:hypothetical protein